MEQSLTNHNEIMVRKIMDDIFEKAINHYKKTLELNPNYYQAYSHLSSIYHNKNLYFDLINMLLVIEKFFPSKHIQI